MPEAAEKTSVEITLGDGSKVVGKDYEEALQNATKMIEDNKKYAREQKERADTLANNNATLAAQVEASKPKPVVKEGEFDRQKYWDMLNSEPMAAQNYLDSFRFGIPDPDQVPQAFIGMSQKITSFEQRSVAADFLSQHVEDFPQTPEAVQNLSAKTQELIRNGHPYGIDTLNLAYQYSISEGKIKPLEKKQTEEIIPNPSLTGSGGRTSQEDAELARFEKMNTQEQEAYLRSKGMIR